MLLMRKHLNKIPLGLLIFLIAITLIFVGVLAGDYEDTLRKAALVCYECIGIG